jgi:hypothetical protein
VLPEAARVASRTGAEAFFRYFIDVYTYTYQSQDTSTMRGISDIECKFCASAIAGIDAARSHRQRIVGGSGTVTTVTAAPGDPHDGLLVNAIVDQQGSQILDNSGKVVQSAPPEHQVRMDAAVRWQGTAWQMRGLHVFTKAKK